MAIGRPAGNRAGPGKRLRQRMDIARETGRTITTTETTPLLRIGPLAFGKKTTREVITPRAFGPPKVTRKRVRKKKKK